MFVFVLACYLWFVLMLFAFCVDFVLWCDACDLCLLLVLGFG